MAEFYDFEWKHKIRKWMSDGYLNKTWNDLTHTSLTSVVNILILLFILFLFLFLIIICCCCCYWCHCHCRFVFFFFFSFSGWWWQPCTIKQHLMAKHQADNVAAIWRCQWQQQRAVHYTTHVKRCNLLPLFSVRMHVWVCVGVNSHLIARMACVFIRKEDEKR